LHSAQAYAAGARYVPWLKYLQASRIILQIIVLSDDVVNNACCSGRSGFKFVSQSGRRGGGAVAPLAASSALVLLIWQPAKQKSLLWCFYLTGSSPFVLITEYASGDDSARINALAAAGDLERVAIPAEKTVTLWTSAGMGPTTVMPGTGKSSLIC